MAGNTKPFSLLEPEVIITVNEEVRILNGVFLSSVGVIICMLYKLNHAPLLLLALCVQYIRNLDKIYSALLASEILKGRCILILVKNDSYLSIHSKSQFSV
jgi:hypothetical protein